MTPPRDFRWRDAPDPDTGRVPLAPTAAADDVPGLRAEAAAWCADPARTLRSGIVADLDAALGRALAERDDARRTVRRLSSRIRAIVGVAHGAPVVFADDPGDPL